MAVSKTSVLLILLSIPYLGFSQENLSEDIQPEYAVSQYPSDSAEAWLSKMATAVRTLNYSISFMVLKPGVDSQPYLWRHGIAEDGTEMEQLNLLNGPGREVVRMGHKVSYFEPNVPPYSLQSSTVNGPFPSELFYQPEKLFASYEFVLVGRSRVAGRAAQQIRVISKDKSRFGLNLWLDQESGLLLKLNMVNLEGQPLEQIQVVAIQVTEKPDPFFARIDLPMLPDILVMRGQQDNPPRWKINYLPTGMRISKQDTHRLPMTGEVVDYILLTDGLVDVSIYLQPMASAKASQDLIGRHESNTILTRQMGEVNVTVVGKIPAVTADAILKSIQFVQ
ncbi:MucB/RseB C-terminal domain-containing protein [Paraglaciecola sp.]|uniref:MucB/RseB C-terminal domain-containing protein n=1 Tax=Paraglaciecola sp. TaxID=1920173 RepID=UPI0030F44FCE